MAHGRSLIEKYNALVKKNWRIPNRVDKWHDQECIERCRGEFYKMIFNNWKVKGLYYKYIINEDRTISGKEEIIAMKRLPRARK